MKKYITTITVALALAGCAGSTLNTGATQALKESKGYKVGEVKVTLAKSGFLDMSREQSLYPDTTKMAAYFKQDIEKYLKQNAASCEGGESCLTLDVDVNYMRKFNLNSVTVSAPVVDRTISIHKGNQVLYTESKKGLKPHSGGMFGSALNEMAVFTKAGNEQPNLEDERKDIDLISKLTVKEVLSLGK